MPVTKIKPNPESSFKPRIKTKKKSYTLKDSALYNIRTKKRLDKILQEKIRELNLLASDANYRVFYIEKSNGKKREIQAPTLGLDIVQTRIASLLTRVAMPDYVHSGVKRRSNVTNASIHVGDHPVLTMDIKNFYPSISKKSIYHFFHHTMLASPDVAGILAELCSYDNHIPTGSRLSMPLSFWANHAMYDELKSLSDAYGATMSIYVDDLTFSGLNVNKLFALNVDRIVTSAGLRIHPDKTRLYKRDEPKLITGVIVRADGVGVRNKHHMAIYNLFNDMKSINNDDDLLKLQKELIGRLCAAGQVDPAFKNRAKSFVASSQ